MGRDTPKRMLRTLALVPVVALVAGCGGSGGGGSYPAAAKNNFLRACEVRASTASCTCELDYITRHVSFNTFAAADKALRNGTGGIPAWLLAAARTCGHAAGSTTT